MAFLCVFRREEHELAQFNGGSQRITGMPNSVRYENQGTVRGGLLGSVGLEISHNTPRTTKHDYNIYLSVCTESHPFLTAPTPHLRQRYLTQGGLEDKTIFGLIGQIVPCL